LAEILDFLDSPIKEKGAGEEHRKILDFLDTPSKGATKAAGPVSPPPPPQSEDLVPGDLATARRVTVPAAPPVAPPPPPQADLGGQEQPEFTPPPAPPTLAQSPQPEALATAPVTSAETSPVLPPADLSGQVQPEFTPPPEPPKPSLADLATGEGVGGGGGSGWGDQKMKGAVEPIGAQPVGAPERAWPLKVVDKATELAAKGLAEGAVPAAEYVGAAHGFTPELSDEDKEKVKTDVGNSLLNFGRGWLQGRTFGLYVPPELTEDQKKIGGEWAQIIGNFAGMGGAIHSIASAVPAGLTALGIKEVAPFVAGKFNKEIIKYAGGVGLVTGLIYNLFDYAGRNAGAALSGTQTEPGFSTGMIASGLEYGAAQLGQPEVAQAIHDGAKALGPVPMAVEFMLFSMGGALTIKLLSSMFEAKQARTIEAQKQTLRNDLIPEYQKAMGVAEGGAPTGAMAAEPIVPTDAQLGQWFQGLPIEERARIVEGSRTGKAMMAWMENEGIPYTIKGKAPEAPPAEAPAPKGPPPAEESINLRPAAEPAPKAPEAPISTAGDAAVPEAKPAAPNLATASVREMVQKAKPAPEVTQATAKVQPVTVGGDASSQVAEKPPEPPTPPPTQGPEAIASHAPPEAPGAPTESIAPTIDWERNPAIQHFQAQGFEFQQALTPEAQQALQAQGFRQSGVAPDLWYKAPAPQEPPAVAQPPAPEKPTYPPAKAEPTIKAIGPGRFELSWYDGEMAHNLPFATAADAMAFKDRIWTPAATPPEAAAPAEPAAPTTPFPSALVGKAKVVPKHPGLPAGTPKEGKDLWYDNTAFTAATQTQKTPGGEVTIPGHRIGDYFIFDAKDQSSLAQEGFKIMRRSDGRSMVGSKTFKKREDALAYAKDLHETDLEDLKDEQALTVTQPAWQLDKRTAMDAWYEGNDGVEHFSNTYYDGNPEEDDATLSHTDEGYKLVREGAKKADSKPIINPDTGDIFFKTADEAKAEYHRQEVMRAKAAGKEVPEKVLAEYPKAKQPDLFSAPEPKAAGPLPTAITGKKAGPVTGAKPVPKGKAMAHAVHPGITGRPPTPPESKAAEPWELDSNSYAKLEAHKKTGQTRVLDAADLDRHKELALQAIKDNKPVPLFVIKEYAYHPDFKKALGPWLFNLQNTTVEHKLPIQDGNANFFEESAGDVFRELTKRDPDPGYINEKLAKLNKFKAMNNADILQTEEALKTVNFDKLGNYVSNLETLKKATEAANLSVMGEQLQALKTMAAIANWLRYPRDKAATTRVRNEIDALVGAVKAGKEGVTDVNADVTGKAPENVPGSTTGEGPKNIPPAITGGKPGTVPKGPGPSDDGVVQPGGSGGTGSKGGTRPKKQPQDNSGREPGSEPVHGAGPDNVAGSERPSDYRITPGELKRPGGWKATASQNLDIIELAKKLEAEGRWATPEEQALLVQYTGFGAGEIRNNIFPRGAFKTSTGKINLYNLKDEWKPLAERLMEITTPEELAEIAQSTQYAHYTSEAVIRSIYRAVENMGFPGGKILEPGMGNGLFGMLIPDKMKGMSKYTGIERDSVTALIAKHLLPQQNVLRADFITKKLPDDFFDMGIGNPPFAKTIILGDPRYAKLRFALHDFFFAKGIDKIRPGGLQIFVTSRYTMDKADSKARQYLAERADFLGAVRLPQTAFKENAGTDVVTDVLFFRKRAPGEIPGGDLSYLSHGEIEVPWEETQTVRTPAGYVNGVWKQAGYEEKLVKGTEKFLINQYFINHPEMVLGANSAEGSMYSEHEYTVKPHEGNIEDHFAKAVENLPKNVYSVMKRPKADIEKVVIERDFNPLVTKEGNVYIDAKGNLMVVEGGSGVSIDDVEALKTLTKNDKIWVRDYVPLRDALKKTHYDQLTDNPDWETSYKALVKVYTAFVKKHGQILDYSTYELPIKENGVPVLDEEKVAEAQNYKKKIKDQGRDLDADEQKQFAQMMDEAKVTRWYRRYKNARRFRADVEYTLVYALEKITDDGDIVKGAALLGRSMRPPEKVDPKTPFEALAVTLDDIGKLDLDLIADKLHIPRTEAIEALGDLIYKVPGKDWVTSDEYLAGDVKTKLEEAQAAAKADGQYQRNVEALERVQPTPLTPAQVSVMLGAPWIEPLYIRQFAQQILGISIPIDFNAQVNTWTVGVGGRSSRNVTTEWGTSDRSAGEILDSVLNNKSMIIKRSEVVNGKRETWTDEPATTRVNEIAKRMKEVFATWVWTDVHRGDDLLAIYNRKYNNLAGRQFDGSHLTLPGLSLKFPLHNHQKRAIWRIIVAGSSYLNHAVGSGKTLEQICAGQELRRLGLVKKVLHVVPNHMLEQFSSDFISAYPMANVMVADEKNFHTENRRRFIAQAALNNPDAIVITHSALGKLGMKPENIAAVRNMFIRDLEDLLAALEAEDPQANRILIAKVQQRIEQMKQRFDGMTNANTDQAIFFEDLGVDCMIVDESHEFRKLDFVTNRQAKGIDSNGSRKALDLYTKIQWLKTQNPRHSHVFATGTPIVNTMGELFTIMRYFDDGQMEDDGIHYFDAWGNMFGEMVTDWEKTGAGNWEQVDRFASFINVPELMKRVREFTDVLTPSQLGGYVKLPAIKGNQAELMLAPELDAVKAYQENVLQPRLETSRDWRPSPGERGNPDPVINIITDGRLAAIDMRFHYPDLPSDPGSKLNLVIDDIIEIFHRTKDYPYFDRFTGEEEPLKGAGQIVFYKLGFGKMITKNRGFDARAWMMQRLKEGGVPASQVAWIDDYPTSTAKGQLSKEVRQGAKRILIGSMQKMGTGLNVQNRMFVSHLLDAPWFPADLEQAEGRTVRQGNQNAQVIMKRWATKGSYDSTMWQMVARKARNIDQAWSGDDSVRNLTDVSRVSQYQMAAAYSSGDQRVIELAQAQGRVAELRRLRDAHHAEQRDLRSKKSNLDFYIPRDKEEIANMKEAEAAVGGYVRDVSARILGKNYTPDDKRADIGMAIQGVFNDRVESRDIKDPKHTFDIGTFNGFKLLLDTYPYGDKIMGTIGIQVTPQKSFWVAGKHGPYAPEDIDVHGGGGMVTRIVNILNNIGRDLAKLESKLDENKAELQRVNKRLGIPFPQEQELIDKEAEVARIQQDLAATGTTAPTPDVSEDLLAGQEAEKTATLRTGPTAATGMRQPTWTPTKVARRLPSAITGAITAANRTGAGGGAMSRPTLVTKWVQENVDPSKSILDFGAGKKAFQTNLLREAGLNVTAYDFGANAVAGVHAMILSKQYQVVMASNVLNVQSDLDMLDKTVSSISQATADDGAAIVNFPKEPRYPKEAPLELSDIEGALKQHFKKIVRIGGTAGAPIWKLSKPIREEGPNVQARFQAAAGAPAQQRNRSGNLSAAGAGAGRELADLQATAVARGNKYDIAAITGLSHSEALAISPEFPAIVQKAVSMGFKTVLPVKGAGFDGAIYPDRNGNSVFLLNEDLTVGTTGLQVLTHEETHHLEKQGDPIITGMIKAVNPKTEAFKLYKEVLNSEYAEEGWPIASDYEIAVEIVGDFRAGLTRVDLGGQDIHIGEVFAGAGSLRSLAKAVRSAPPAGGAAQARASMFGFRMKPKAVVPTTAREMKGIEKWLGEREISDFDPVVLAGARQRALMEALGKKKYDKEAQLADNALTHYVELQAFPDHVAWYYDDLKPIDKKAVDYAQNEIPNNPALKAIADELVDYYKMWRDKALAAGVIHDSLDAFMAHIWDLDREPPVEKLRKFGPKTGHAMKRTFDTEMQGLAATYDPLVRSAINKAMIYAQDIAKAIADRSFIEREMGKTVSTDRSELRPAQIEHPNMRGWKWAGSIEVEPIISYVQKMTEEIKNTSRTSSTTTGPGSTGAAPGKGPVEAMKEVVRNSLIIRGMTEGEANAYINRIETAAVKAKTGQTAAIPGQAPPESTTTVIRELRETIVKIENSQEVIGHNIKPVARKDFYVDAGGDIFQKVPLYASEGAAEKLNNVLGTSALHKIKALSKAIDVSNSVKQLVLFLSGYHHQAGMRGWLLGVTGQVKQHGLKGLSPRWTYRQGLKLIRELDPTIRHGVENGLLLGITPEWREYLSNEKGKISAKLDKWKVSAAVREKVFNLWDQQVNFLFGKLFPGLQSMAYVTEFKNFMAKFPNSDPNEAAKKVAELCNYNFGNLNYARLGSPVTGGKQGRNPTLQHIFQGVFLAPQWTESNWGPVRELIGAILGGDQERIHIYKKFWASVVLKGLAVLLIGNLLMSLGDDKDAWESFKERWSSGRLRWLGLNITPIYRGIYNALGVEPGEGQKVFSPLGHFLDVLKMVSHPLLFLQHKGSPLAKFLYEAFAGENWKGQPYTEFGELIGTSEGGALQGKYVKEGKSTGPISISQMPSFLLGQIRGASPIPGGNLMGMLGGEMDAFDALTKSSGTMISSFTPKTEAQGLIKNYYQATLPGRNLTPAQVEKQNLEKELLKQARGGDMEGFTDRLADLMADGKFTRTEAKDLMKQAQMPAGVASFAKLPLDVALKVFDAATDAEKEIWGPSLLSRINRAQPETLQANQDALVNVLSSLGMEDVAGLIGGGLSIPQYRPGIPGRRAPFMPLSEMNQGTVESTLGQSIRKKTQGAAEKTKIPSGKREQMRRIGLG